jgi:hypothetical protein
MRREKARSEAEIILPLVFQESHGASLLLHGSNDCFFRAL